MTAVAVESEIRDHAAHALLALRAGKHVHLEKPCAATLADARAVIALAREKKLLVQGGFMWRYHPGFRAIFEAVRQGWLGDVYLVRGFISNSLPAARRAEIPSAPLPPLANHYAGRKAAWRRKAWRLPCRNCEWPRHAE